MQPYGVGRSSSAGPSSVLLLGQAVGTASGTPCGFTSSLATIFDSSDDLDYHEDDAGRGDDDGMGGGVTLRPCNNIGRDASDEPRNLGDTAVAGRNDVQQVRPLLCDPWRPGGGGSEGLVTPVGMGNAVYARR